MSRVGRTGILFVCMGNICRSPLAEGLFRHKANQRNVIDQFTIDSAGTGGWHAGEPPDPRMRHVAKEHGIVLSGRARQVTSEDFQRFKHLLCMDEDNYRKLVQMGAPEDRTKFLLDFDPNAPVREVPDPYYGGDEGFEKVFKLVDRACEALLESLVTEKHEH